MTCEEAAVNIELVTQITGLGFDEWCDLGNGMIGGQPSDASPWGTVYCSQDLDGMSPDMRPVTSCVVATNEVVQQPSFLRLDLGAQYPDGYRCVCSAR